jgi:hypothetical protein
MMPLTRHIEDVRQRPEHIRRQIALGVAALITAIIALIWLGTSVATGAFALKGSSFADATSGAPTKQFAASTGGFGNLVGAASAVFTGGVKGGEAHIEIVDTGKSSTLDTKKAAAAEPTILPF